MCGCSLWSRGDAVSWDCNENPQARSEAAKLLGRDGTLVIVKEYHDLS